MEVSEDGITLLQGDALAVLSTLPDASVSCCVTSPPYWGLRAYKAGAEEIGSEPTPDAYVAALVAVFREVRRVLRDDGTLWLNLGDSMAAGKSGRDDNSASDRARMDEHGHGGGVKLQEKGNTGKARKVPQSAYVELRDDLTPEEVAYVLRELSYGTSDK